MKILNNRVQSENQEEKIVQLQTKNQGEIIKPQYLIIHYTAGRSAESSVSTFQNPKEQKSAHIVIGRDGKIFQLIDFNRKAWHAGKSRWADLVGMNGYSIGIELDNPGKLRNVNDKYYSWFGAEYNKNNVLHAKHKHQDAFGDWHTFTEEQLNACIMLSKLLVSKYNLKDILGHEDIAPHRKEDPGPAFPMESFKASVLGRNDDIGDIFIVNTNEVNFRKGAGTTFESMGKLKQNTKVEYIESKNGWFYVFIVDENVKTEENIGWINSSLLTKK